mmetsp:Transcript_106996/g.320003  ORF Transcript_106996/g.320003 Transcript_106996/m.320003 type:complete len:348 (-) Transcript_106996:28-1071(-)
MTAKMVANMGAGVAAFIAINWVILACANLSWVYSQSMLVGFDASLMTVYTTKGTITHVAAVAGRLFGAHKAMNKFDAMLEQRLWYQEALQHFCSAGMETVFRWCDTWTMITYASWGTLATGISAAGLLFTGAGFTYYYANVHPTATGRTCCNACYILAPCISTLGLIIYTLGTLDFGKDNMNVFQGMQANSMYGSGFIIAWALAFFSWIPLYTLAVFMRRDPWEHKHESDDEACAANSYSQGQPYPQQVSSYTSTTFPSAPPLSQLDFGAPPTAAHPGPPADFGTPQMTHLGPQANVGAPPTAGHPGPLADFGAPPITHVGPQANFGAPPMVQPGPPAADFGIASSR